MKFTFSSCGVKLPKRSLSYGKSGTDETKEAYTPVRNAFRRSTELIDEEVGDYAGQAQRPPEKVGASAG